MGGENDLRPQERESYLATVRMLEPLGIPLLGAVEDYVDCRLTSRPHRSLSTKGPPDQERENR
jgi:hypothetical protein